MTFHLNKLVRANILELKPYSSARDEFQGEANILLDANENPYNTPYNRYPDPMQWQVKERIAQLKGVDKTKILLGNGSDEPIDLLFRALCEPAVDNIVAIEPTYGMYQVCADINNVAYRRVELDQNFDFEAEKLLAAADEQTKIIFLCSPNNPTGNMLSRNEIERLLDQFHGIVVVDEAYIDFSSQEGFLSQLDKYPNLVVLQTLSKAWGCAAIRLGMCFASSELIAILNKIKYPYNINQLTQEQALKALSNEAQVRAWVEELNHERAAMAKALSQMAKVHHIYPSQANFLLVKVEDAQSSYNKLVELGIIVRNRTNVTLCHNALRITIGTPDENRTLLKTLEEIMA